MYCGSLSTSWCIESLVFACTEGLKKVVQTAANFYIVEINCFEDFPIAVTCKSSSLFSDAVKSSHVANSLSYISGPLT